MKDEKWPEWSKKQQPKPAAPVKPDREDADLVVKDQELHKVGIARVPPTAQPADPGQPPAKRMCIRHELSQTRDKNPWHTSEYKGNVYRNLLNTLVPDVFRSCCNQLKMITDLQTERLMHEKIRIEHNEQLLMMISSSGFRGYAKLREIVRSMRDQVDFPRDLLMKMDSVGWDPEEHTECQEYRKILRSVDH